MPNLNEPAALQHDEQRARKRQQQRAGEGRLRQADDRAADHEARQQQMQQLVQGVVLQAERGAGSHQGPLVPGSGLHLVPTPHGPQVVIMSTARHA